MVFCLMKVHMQVRQLFRPDGAPGLLLLAVKHALVHLPDVGREVLSLEGQKSMRG